jgi:photosystem II stability/assembly factor-like uncharacterized protein
VIHLDTSSSRLPRLLKWAGTGVCALAVLTSACRRAPKPEPKWAEQAPLAERSLLLDADVVGGTIIVVGERGHVLLSGDEGTSWTQAQVPARIMLCAVKTAGDRHAWAVGHDATILHSSDRGRTWSLQHQAPDEEAPFLDVWFADEGHGLAVGAYGLVLETTDGGERWEPIRVSDEDPHFYCLAEGPGGDLYLAGEFGVLFRSIDRGRTWYPLVSPYRGSLFGVLVLSDDTVVVYGLRGNVYRSEDHGETWQPVSTRTTASILGGTQMTDGTVVLVGLSGTVLVSRDQGRSFASRNRSDRKAISAVLEVDTGRLLFVGEDGISWVESLGKE